MKRSPIRKISHKKAIEKRIEADLRAELLEDHGGLCQLCHRQPDWRGLSLHHKKFKSHGGATDHENTELICGKCHSLRHGIVEK